MVEGVGRGLGTGTEFQAISAADFGSGFLLMVGVGLQDFWDPY